MSWSIMKQQSHRSSLGICLLVLPLSCNILTDNSIPPIDVQKSSIQPNVGIANVNKNCDDALFMRISGVQVPRALVQRMIAILNGIRECNYGLFDEIVQKARANKPVSQKAAEILKSYKVIVDDKGKIGQCARAVILAVIAQDQDTCLLYVYDITHPVPPNLL